MIQRAFIYFLFSSLVLVQGAKADMGTTVGATIALGMVTGTIAMSDGGPKSRLAENWDLFVCAAKKLGQETVKGPAWEKAWSKFFSGSYGPHAVEDYIFANQKGPQDRSVALLSIFETIKDIHAEYEEYQAPHWRFCGPHNPYQRNGYHANHNCLNQVTIEQNPKKFCLANEASVKGILEWFVDYGKRNRTYKAGALAAKWKKNP